MTAYNPDPRYCFLTEFIYANNSMQLAIQKDPESELFCIFENNLETNETSTHFLDRRPVENITDFLKLESRHRKFLWSEGKREFWEYSPFEEIIYTAGKPIWTYSEDTDSLGKY